MNEYNVMSQLSIMKLTFNVTTKTTLSSCGGRTGKLRRSHLHSSDGNVV